MKDRIYVCHTYYHVYITFLKELKLRPGVLLAVIVRKNNIIIPEGSSFLQEGDRVIIIARGGGVLDLNDIYGAEPNLGGAGA